MENIVSFMGAFLKHIIGVLLLCWRRMLRAGLIAFAIGVVVVMLVAVIATGQAFPGALALVVALIFGAALAYGIALTVFIEEFLLGVVDLIKLLEGDAKGVAHLTATVAEREVGDVAHGLRRLFGLPVATRPAPPTPTLPALPALPRYPATPAPTAPHPDTLAREAALAGGVSLLAAAASVTAAASPARPAQAPAEPAAPAEPPTATDPAPTPTGEPVRADRLPRIGWTYEHEAIRPVRPAPPPETLAELAGAATVGAGSLLAASAAHGADAPSTADEPATSADEAVSAPIVVAATAPEPLTPEPEPLDVSVVSAETPGAPEAAAIGALADDAPALDDERLAEPLALTLPDDEAATLASDAKLDAPLDAPIDPAMLTPAPATTPLAPEAVPVDEPVDEPAIDPAMLTSAPATIPLPLDEAPDEAPLDPAMLTPAPATTPFVPVTEPPLAEPAPTAATLTAASDASDASASQAAPAEVAPADAPADAPEAIPDALPDTAHEPAGGDAARVRSVFSRITRPVAGLGTALDAINRVAPSTGPRASAPESGLWERLSQALIDRSGAPSSPFAAPQGRPASPDAGDGASEDAGGGTNTNASDETPQG